jgi:hypothetical protein
LQEENPASKPKPKEYEMVYGEFLEISHIWIKFLILL